MKRSENRLRNHEMRKRKSRRRRHYLIQKKGTEGGQVGGLGGGLDLARFSMLSLLRDLGVGERALDIGMDLDALGMSMLAISSLILLIVRLLGEGIPIIGVRRGFFLNRRGWLGGRGDAVERGRSGGAGRGELGSWRGMGSRKRLECR
jgi:hypothetical protein